MPISINVHSTRFFLALAKQEAHTFLMLGTYKDNQVEHLLCRVGKAFNVSPKASFVAVCMHLTKALFSSTEAILEDEGLSRHSYGHTPITYQAYDITFRQYVDFIQILESLETEKNKFICYKPLYSMADSYILESTRIKRFKSKSLPDELDQATAKISISNTCRHGAIQLVEEVLHTSLSSHVSSHYFRELPCQSYLDFGVPSKQVPFYVLPPPPNVSLQAHEGKQIAIRKLYKRMEDMVKLEPNSAQTADKFACLKNLYNQLVEEKEQSLSELLESIHNWKQQHWSTLNTLRKTYFWDAWITRKTATVQTIEEIEHDLQPDKPNTLGFPF